jgi:hypothetical protein
MGSSARLGGFVALAGAAALGAAAFAGAGGWPHAGPVQILVLVAFGVVVGLSTAASP